MEIENQDPIVTKVLNEILKDKSLWTPVYRADLRTEDDVRKTRDLPLVCIWNENRVNGSCNVSVNGTMVAELLENHVDRSDDRFAHYRDKISTIVAEVSNESVVETCQRLRRFPSELFTSK